jgi:hypothetical protein
MKVIKFNNLSPKITSSINFLASPVFYGVLIIGTPYAEA